MAELVAYTREVGAGSKRRLAAAHGCGAALLGVFLVACGGGTESDADEATSSSTGSTATSGSTGPATATSGGGMTGSGSGHTASTTSATSNSSTSGNSDPWVCLEISSGCLCSTIPGSEGETSACATTYACCYGLEGSTCYCLETPEAMCDEIIAVGYTRYDSCPPP